MGKGIELSVSQSVRPTNSPRLLKPPDRLLLHTQQGKRLFSKVTAPRFWQASSFQHAFLFTKIRMKAGEGSSAAEVIKSSFGHWLQGPSANPESCTLVRTVSARLQLSCRSENT